MSETHPNPSSLFRSPEGRIWFVTSAVAALSAIGTIPLLGADISLTDVGIGVVLTLFVAAAERWSLPFKVGTASHLLTLAEIPVIVGLFLVSPITLVTARIVGGLVARRILRPTAWLKTAFNGAFQWAETLLAIALLGVIGPQHVTDGVRGAVAVVAVALLLAATGALAMTSALSAMKARYQPGLFTSAFKDGIGPTLSTTAVATIGLALAGISPALLWAPSVVIVVLLGAYRAYLNLLETRDLQQQVLEVTHQITGDATPEETLAAVLESSRAVMDARSARVRLPDDQEGPPEWRTEDPAERVALEHFLGVETGTHATAATCCAPRLQAVVAPMDQSRGHWLGLCFERDAAINDDQRQVIAVLANHAAVALSNAERGTDLQRKADEARYRALHDELTGLPNRAALIAELADLVEEGSPAALVILDLNRFKAVNDALGHSAGDELLKGLATRLGPLRDSVRLVARLGGNEFAVTLAGGKSAAAAVATHLLDVLSAPLQMGPFTMEMTGRVGIAQYPDHAATAGELLKHADLAVLEAKSRTAGVAVFGLESGGRVLRQLEIASALRAAIREGHITMVAQPLVDLSSGEIRSIEALARWTHPTLGPVGPDEFIEIAEQAGLITELTERQLDITLEWQRRWSDEGLVLDVAVNLSSRSLMDDRLIPMIERLLTKHEVAPERLTLELTEGSILTNPEQSIKVLKHLRMMGISLSIDDFGTGYSSLGYLQRIPATTVKIDRSFVLPMLTDRASRSLVLGTIRLCKELGFQLVAEGIEDEQTEAALQRAGCDFGQGFGIGRPMPPGAIMDWVVKSGRAPHPTADPVGAQTVIS